MPPKILAISGLAYRYALRALNPFAGRTTTVRHTADGQLLHYQRSVEWQMGNMTDQYLNDRGAFSASTRITLSIPVSFSPSQLITKTWRRESKCWLLSQVFNESISSAVAMLRC